jgi:hypothetical protein
MINKIDSRIDGMRTRLDTASVATRIFPPDPLDVDSTRLTWISNQFMDSAPQRN